MPPRYAPLAVAPPAQNGIASGSLPKARVLPLLQCFPLLNCTHRRDTVVTTDDDVATT